MPLTDFGVDDAWQSRLPQGWTTLPDGSIGPSSSLPDWLKQLIPSPGAGAPYGPGGAPSYGVGPGGVMPGGGLMGRQAVTPGAPSMGYPAQGGPQMYAPQGSNIGTGKQVGPWTNPFTDAHINPQTGQPEYVGGPGATIGPGSGAGGGFNPLSLLAGGNPYARAAIAAGGVMAPTPAETGELPLSLSGARPEHPPSTGAMPRQPYDPLSSIRTSPAAAVAAAPPGSPSQTPRPGSSGSGPPMPPARPRTPPAPSLAPAKPPASNSRFSTFQYQVPGSGYGPLSRAPIYTALNLFGGRS